MAAVAVLSADRLTAAALLLIAVVALQDTFKASGWEGSVPGSGWYPFWSAAMLAAAALVPLASRGVTRVFSSPGGLSAMLRVAVPMVAVAAAIPWLGFYVTSGVYMGGFARWQGRYPWVAIAALAAGLPIALYLCFEQGFRLPLPKSMLYQAGVVPF